MVSEGFASTVPTGRLVIAAAVEFTFETNSLAFMPQGLNSLNAFLRVSRTDGSSKRPSSRAMPRGAGGADVFAVPVAVRAASVESPSPPSMRSTSTYIEMNSRLERTLSAMRAAACECAVWETPSALSRSMRKRINSETSCENSLAVTCSGDGTTSLM